jgi:PAS domain-containing protein
METRESAQISQEQLARFVRPLIERLDGVTRANELYFEWLGRDDLPDNRKLFRALANGTRRIGPRQTFTLGLFFWQHFGWCTPLTMLYAAGHLDRYVLVISKMIEANGITPSLRRTIQCTPDATWLCELDGIKVLENPLMARFFNESRREISFGSHFALDTMELEFEDLWRISELPSFDRKPFKNEYLRRDQARRRSWFNSSFIDELGSYVPLLTSDGIEPRIPELLIAFKCGQIADLHPELKRSPVADYLRTYLMVDVRARRKAGREVRSKGPLPFYDTDFRIA